MSMPILLFSVYVTFIFSCVIQMLRNKEQLFTFHLFSPICFEFSKFEMQFLWTNK
jgi:hypothetical protein